MATVYRLITDVSDLNNLRVIRLEPYDDEGVEKERYLDYEDGYIAAIVYSLHDDDRYRPTEKEWYLEVELELSKSRFEGVHDLISFFTKTTAPIPYEPPAEETPTYDGEVVLTDLEKEALNQRWTAITVIAALITCFIVAVYMLS